MDHNSPPSPSIHQVMCFLVKFLGQTSMNHIGSSMSALAAFIAEAHLPFGPGCVDETSAAERTHDVTFLVRESRDLVLDSVHQPRTRSTLWEFTMHSCAQ